MRFVSNIVIVYFYDFIEKIYKSKGRASENCHIPNEILLPDLHRKCSVIMLKIYEIESGWCKTALNPEKKRAFRC